MFKQLDGTDRQPRKIQIDVLKWLENELKLNRPACINAPTGSGKSFIVESLLLEYPGSVAILPSNALMTQYHETYPTRNYVKGKEHYECKEHPGLDCLTAQEELDSKCPECDYTINKRRALAGESTVFNPISYYYFKRQNRDFNPECVIVDEAHKLGDMASLLVDVSFRKSKYYYPEIKDEIALVAWLKELVDTLTYKIRSDKNKSDDRDRMIKDKDKVENILYSLSVEPQNFVFQTEKRSYHSTVSEYLTIRSVTPPKAIVREMLSGQKKVLMSATLLHHKIWELGFHNYGYLDLDSPIDTERRPIAYQPASTELNFKSSATLVGNYIKQVLNTYPGLNTIVHVSYAWADKLKPLFPGAMFNDPSTKNETLERFKEKGGVWIASGCSEGIDLPGDLCRLIIIPILSRENVTDPVVMKRLAMHKGNQKYDLNTISTLIQQAGRGTRGEEDYCLTVVGDRKLPMLMVKNKSMVPKSFYKAIKWSHGSTDK